MKIFAVILILLHETISTSVNQCDPQSDNDSCSTNRGCGCLRTIGTDVESYLCLLLSVDCAHLAPCDRPGYTCKSPTETCVHHLKCHKEPLCYPTSMVHRRLCPVRLGVNTTKPTATDPTTSVLENPIPVNARWSIHGTTVAGGNKQGNSSNQFAGPRSLLMESSETLFVVDSWNERIVAWRLGEQSGRVVAGGHGQGNRLDQLNRPTTIAIDRNTNSLIICDRGNLRVVRWSLDANSTSGQIVIPYIDCWGLALDESGFLYVTDVGNRRVMRYSLGTDAQPVVVAGGNGKGNQLNQLNWPLSIFVDREQNVYVSDNENDRVVQWKKDAAQGTVVAAGHGRGNDLSQLKAPLDLFVDSASTVYVADWGNDRVMRWRHGQINGEIIAGGQGWGDQQDQLSRPSGLALDRSGNLYVTDHYNQRIQKFSIE